MKKNCRVCGNEFFASNNRITCSDICSSINKKEKRKLNKNWDTKMREASNELGLPRQYIDEYGYDFLTKNPIVVEALRIQYFMTGRYNGLPDDVVEARKLARKTPKECNREKFVPKVRSCKICGGDYIGRGSQKTCSDKCSSELNKRTIKLNRERNKGKVYKRDKEKIKADYKKRWAEISALAKEKGITTREAKKLLSNKNK